MNSYIPGKLSSFWDRKLRLSAHLQLNIPRYVTSLAFWNTPNALFTLANKTQQTQHIRS